MPSANPMPANVAAFIASLAASYVQPTFSPSGDRQGRPVAPPAGLVKVNRKPATKLAQVKAERAANVAPQTEGLIVKPIVTSIPLPEKGTLDARSYLIAMRRATDRDMMIRAIAGYVGFDRTVDYGAQELAANMQANRAMRPLPACPKVPGASASLAGYKSATIGMPDAVARRKGDLQGRCVLAAESICEAEKSAKLALESGDMDLAAHFAKVAELESSKLEAIRYEFTSF